MKVQRMITVLGLAGITMAGTLAWTLSAPVQAVHQNAKADIMPIIDQPLLDVDGCQIRLNTNKEDYAVGDEPVVLLHVSNVTNKQAATVVQLDMTASTVQSMLSRVPVLPERVWSKKCELALEPGATQQMRLPTGHELTAGSTVRVTLSSEDQQGSISKLLKLEAPPTKPAVPPRT